MIGVSESIIAKDLNNMIKLGIIQKRAAFFYVKTI